MEITSKQKEAFERDGVSEQYYYSPPLCEINACSLQFLVLPAISETISQNIEKWANGIKVHSTEHLICSIY